MTLHRRLKWLAPLGLFLYCASLPAEEKDFSITLPAKLDDGTKINFNATTVAVTFNTLTIGIKQKDSKANPDGSFPASDVFEKRAKTASSINEPAKPFVVYFEDGALMPGAPFEFVGVPAAGKAPYIAKVVFYNVTFDNKGKPVDKKIIEISPATNPKAFKKGVLGIINNDYFDFSDPSNATFNLINNAPGDSAANVQYTLENLRIYTNLPESNFTEDTFDTVGTATPVFNMSSVVVAPGQAVSIPLGPVGAPGQSYAVALTDGTITEDLDSNSQQVAGPLSIGGDGAPSTAQPDRISTTASGLLYSRVTKTFNGTVTITNTGQTTIDGPFTIVFTSLTPGVSLANYTGVLEPDPYLSIPIVTGLAPSESATVNVQFSNPANALINFIPQVFAGSFQ